MISKRSELLLVVLFALLFIPFILEGGLLRDDLFSLPGRLTSSSYLEYQRKISSGLVMTARPVSALLHGFSFWFFGDHPWVLHTINLVLFLGSIFFAFQAIKNLIGLEIAWLTAVFVMVYPSAAGTLYSAIMMNSNLAGLFWTLALYLDTRTIKGRRIWNDAAVTALLLLSALSYEAFIPLFLANLIVRIVRIPPPQRNTLRILQAAAPFIISAMCFGLYRSMFEKAIFHNEYTRIASQTSLMQGIWVFIRSNAYGLKISSWDAVMISVRAVRDLRMITPVFLLGLVAAVLLYSILVYRTFSCLEPNGEEIIFINGPPETHAHNWVKILHHSRLRLAILCGVLFAASQLIFVFSNYYPSSYGFENRTQGGIRFAASLLLVSVIIYILSITTKVKSRITVCLLSAVLFFLFSLSIIGQGQAWIAAAKYNDKVLARIQEVLLRSEAYQTETKLTLLAELPAHFPGEVNGEPIFGETWDLWAALSLRNPEKEIRAGIYWPERTTILQDGVTIDKNWHANYPLLFYIWPEDQIHTIANQDELNLLIKGMSITD